jgi:hypothetical protein
LNILHLLQALKFDFQMVAVLVDLIDFDFHRLTSLSCSDRHPRRERQSAIAPIEARRASP